MVACSLPDYGPAAHQTLPQLARQLPL